MGTATMRPKAIKEEAKLPKVKVSLLQNRREASQHTGVSLLLD